MVLLVLKVRVGRVRFANSHGRMRVLRCVRSSSIDHLAWSQPTKADLSAHCSSPRLRNSLCGGILFPEEPSVSREYFLPRRAESMESGRSAGRRWRERRLVPEGFRLRCRERKRLQNDDLFAGVETDGRRSGVLQSQHAQQCRKFFFAFRPRVPIVPSRNARRRQQRRPNRESSKGL